VQLLSGEPGSISYHQRSLSICRKIGDERGIAWSTYGLAEVAFVGGDLDLALTLLADASTVFEQIECSSGRARSHLLSGDVRRRRAEVVGGRDAPACLINRRVGPARSVGVCSLSLARVRVIAQVLGGTTNDVVLAVVAGGLRTWLRSRNEPVDGVTPRALIPVNTRARGGAGNNQLSGFLCDLPVGLADPVDRLRAVRAAMDANKAAGPARGAGTIAILANRLPAVAHRLCAGPAAVAAPLLFDTVVTNVPLPTVPLTIGGAPLDEIYPFGPLGPGQALGLAISQYRDWIHIGLQTDRDAVPDIDVLANAVTKACSTLNERAD
jgi:WS/DGAT/MGAT family acyltransferase